MKRFYPILFFAACSVFFMAGCKKSFDELNVNENKPTSVPPSLVFNGILYDMYDAPYSMYERWGQYYCCNYDYYGNNRYDFGSGSNYYSTLKNVGKMEEEALKNGAGALNPYSALAKFFRAYFFTKMSLQMGDIPMTEALKGSANLTPAYDPQKKVFQQAFVWLDSANTQLGQLITANDLSLNGDIYLDNNLRKWRKVVNTFRLRLLINLSKKEADADLNIKQQFATILGDANKYPLMTSMDDNLQFKFTHPTNDYPMSPNNFGFDALRYNTSATYISLLTQTHDPRVFVTAEPATALVAGGMSPTDFNAFVGASPGEDLGVMYVKANSGQYSLINRKHYYETYTGEPSIQIGYPEMLFNIAEAINRGWVASGPLGNAEAHYQAGIEASMAYYGIPETGAFTANFLQSGSPGSSAIYNSYSVNFDFTTYYNQASVKYSANNATALTQILKQKYIALFRHSGLESYFNYRRTGTPVFTTGPGTGNGSRIAMRFKYPTSEQTANADHYHTALQSQFGGNDDINGMMWILN
ncbi:MAG: SusD/RagB family nutrient-binding outer membrane lipoprotein [Bacteroidota bacterium]|nr:SusD/RagB family nutrient-binding outer membrane lipoprotein [Bacteroidota bacterium]